LTGTDSNYQPDETYTYDENGNRTMTGYETDADNRLTSDGTYTYEYDGEGNRTKRTTIATGETVEYTWDYRNRLTAVTYKDSEGETTEVVTYTYDVFDRRIAKSVDGTPVERYVYDGANILFVFDGEGNLKARYLQGPGIDNTLAQEDGQGNVTWLLPDDQGTIRDVIGNDGVVLDHLTYDSFGNILTQTNSSDAPRYTFTGREWDADAGLFYYRARWYDAGTGCFISDDPLEFVAGDANIARYCGNDPGNGVDPMGLQGEVSSQSSWGDPTQADLLSRFPPGSAIREFPPRFDGTPPIPYPPLDNGSRLWMISPPSMSMSTPSTTTSVIRPEPTPGSPIPGSYSPGGGFLSDRTSEIDLAIRVARDSEDASSEDVVCLDWALNGDWHRVPGDTPRTGVGGGVDYNAAVAAKLIPPNFDEQAILKNPALFASALDAWFGSPTSRIRGRRCGPNDFAGVNQHKVAVYIYTAFELNDGLKPGRGFVKDYHVITQQGDCTWTEKRGKTPGVNPTSPAKQKSKVFVGYWMIDTPPRVPLK
jgi:RHS repeat-associated protein